MLTDLAASRSLLATEPSSADNCTESTVDQCTIAVFPKSKGPASFYGADGAVDFANLVIRSARSEA